MPRCGKGMHALAGYVSTNEAASDVSDARIADRFDIDHRIVRNANKNLTLPTSSRPWLSRTTLISICR